ARQLRIPTATRAPRGRGPLLHLSRFPAPRRRGGGALWRPDAGPARRPTGRHHSRVFPGSEALETGSAGGWRITWRDPTPASIPRRRRARIPDAGTTRSDALRWRSPADPPGQPDRQRPDRRALRVGRADDRLAPARQRPTFAGAAEPARPWQHDGR